MTLDPTTVLFMLLLFTSAMAVMAVGLARTMPGFIHGLGLWALALALYAASTAGLLVGINRTMMGAVFNNALYLGHVMLVPVAIARLFERPPRWGVWASLTALVWLGYAAAVTADHRDLARTLVMGLTVAALSAGLVASAQRLRQQVSVGVLALVSGTTLWVGAALLRVVELQRTGSNPGSMLDAQNLDVVVYLVSLAVAVLVTSVGVFMVASEIVRNQLARLASHDSLTGILARRGFFDQAHVVLSIARRQQRTYGVAMLDIDRFKGINDRFGHAAGDAVLRAAAESMQRTVRGSDVLGRLGGEEFAVLMPDGDAHACQQAAERLREALEGSFAVFEAQRIGFTASIGVAMAGSADEPIATVLQRADDALYEAKNGGRNRVVISATAAGSASDTSTTR